VPCTERPIRRRSALPCAVVASAILFACASPEEARPPPARSSPAPAARPAAPAPASAERQAAALPPPGPVRSWPELRRQAALRLVAANPDITYTGKVPDQLLAIPVLEIELNGDGSIRRIEVLRTPRQAKDTLQTAIDATRRAAPFGDVSRLPKPWKYVETFLFDDARKFKPRTLDE
jgi:hypothetical protein